MANKYENILKSNFIKYCTLHNKENQNIYNQWGAPQEKKIVKAQKIHSLWEQQKTFRQR